MNANGLLRKHWFHVMLHFAADSVFFVCALAAGFFVRFGNEAASSFWQYWPFVVFASLVLSSAIYITGLYSTHSASQGHYRRSAILFCALLLTLGVLIGTTYLSFFIPLGRGVIVIGGVIAYGLVLSHHTVLLHALRTTRERVAYLLTSAFDEAEARLFTDFGGRDLEFVGVVTALGYEPKGKFTNLGTLETFSQAAQERGIGRILCTSKNLGNVRLITHFCKLRYSGVSVMPLINLCEEVEQYVPLELVSHEWLLNASGEPQLLYIKKVKRLFDIAASILGLVLGAPLVALAAAAIKLSSPGPVFYRQTRSGRFGESIRITKLRTMHVDAEKGGAQWSGDGDPRVHPIGQILRKYRIDEIPQLWQVFKGHMSFVGPRPERPEMIAELAKQIPFYLERVLVQPGITGWAQVNYPYGASVQDARHKLEYDLYYMKHMSVFLDAFILLDTVRTILCGGAHDPARHAKSNPDVILEWERLKEEESRPPEALELGAA